MKGGVAIIAAAIIAGMLIFGKGKGVQGAQGPAGVSQPVRIDLSNSDIPTEKVIHEFVKESQAPGDVRSDLTQEKYNTGFLAQIAAGGAGKAIEAQYDPATGNLLGVTFEKAIAETRSGGSKLGRMTITTAGTTVYSPSGKVPALMTQSKTEAFRQFRQKTGRAPSSSEWSQITKPKAPTPAKTSSKRTGRGNRGTSGGATPSWVTW